MFTRGAPTRSQAQHKRSPAYPVRTHTPNPPRATPPQSKWTPSKHRPSSTRDGEREARARSLIPSAMSSCVPLLSLRCPAAWILAPPRPPPYPRPPIASPHALPASDPQRTNVHNAKCLHLRLSTQERRVSTNTKHLTSASHPHTGASAAANGGRRRPPVQRADGRAVARLEILEERLVARVDRLGRPLL